MKIRKIGISIIMALALLLTAMPGFTSKAAQYPIRVKINPDGDIEVGKEATLQVSLENISEETYKADELQINVFDASDTVTIEKGWNIVESDAVSKGYDESVDGCPWAVLKKDLAPEEKVEFAVKGTVEKAFDDTNPIQVSISNVTGEDEWTSVGFASYPLGVGDSILDGVYKPSKLDGVKRGEPVEIGVEITNPTAEDINDIEQDFFWYAANTSGDWYEDVECELIWEKAEFNEEGKTISIAVGETIKGKITAKIPENAVPSSFEVGVYLYKGEWGEEDFINYFTDTVTLNMEGGVLNPYGDVDPEDPGCWYAEAALDMLDKGIMTGMEPDRFGASEKVSRAQFATILYRLEGEPTVEYSAEAYPDLSEEEFNDPKNFFAKAAIWAKEAGVVTGYTHNGFFGAGDDITREQMATMLYRYGEHLGMNMDAEGDLSKFADADMVSDFAKEGVEWTIANELIKGEGDSGNINPQGNAERGHCAMIMMRFTRAF